MASETAGISIVVPAYNEARILPDTLPTFNRAREEFERQFQLPTELIIVDNVSTDDTAKVAESLRARVIRHDVRNIASVRNAGIRGAKHELVITVDADSYLPQYSFTRIWKAMETGRYVGGGTRLGMSSSRAHLRVIATVVETVVVALSGISAGLYFFRKDAALAIGGFPETLLIAEDMTFARELKRHGRTHGLDYLNLRTVTVLTLDRKNAPIWEMTAALLAGLKAFRGSAPVSKEGLDYWYKPRR